MRTLTRWHPFSHVADRRALFDRLFDDSFFRPYRVGTWALEDSQVALDMYQTDDNVVVKASLPGLKAEDVDISIEGSVLTIKAEIQESTEEEKEDYVLRERRSGSFHRSVRLPRSLNTDETEATFEDGVLTVTIPKAEEAKPKAIKVKAGKQIEGKKA